MERRDTEYFSQWLEATREEEKERQKKDKAQAEFKALGSGGEEDQEAWEQWYAYVDWVAEDRPDDLEHGKILDSDDEKYVPGADEVETFDHEPGSLPDEVDAV